VHTLEDSHRGLDRDFAQRLTAFRKGRGHTQRTLVDRVQVHLPQISHETGDNQAIARQAASSVKETRQ